ncbi:MAG: ribose 5-phosphate isomerase B [Deltaproteobacteria bacterium]|nr:ribose 5-phosphate isomerase B [Deltaproteobacteria bacterium]
MDIVIGSDHAGYDLKEAVKAFLAESPGYRVKDIGVFSRESADYPKIARQVAEAVAGGMYERGILVCGSGIGMSIAANRHKGVRAALCLDLYTARMCRLHNDANVLTMGGRILGPGLAFEIVDTFLKTPFEGGRHESRINQMDS